MHAVLTHRLLAAAVSFSVGARDLDLVPTDDSVRLLGLLTSYRVGGERLWMKSTCWSIGKGPVGMWWTRSSEMDALTGGPPVVRQTPRVLQACLVQDNAQLLGLSFFTAGTLAVV